MQIYAAYSHTMPGHILTKKGLYLESCFALSARVAEVTEVKCTYAGEYISSGDTLETLDRMAEPKLVQL